MYKKSTSEKLIISIIVIIVIICIILGAIVTTMKKVNNVEQDEQVYDGEIEEEKYIKESDGLELYGDTKNDSISQMAYFDINACMSQFLDAINKNNGLYYEKNEKGDFVSTIENDDIKKAIFNLLSSRYIKNNNIDINNLYNNINLLNEKALFVLLDASLLQDQDISSFAVHGLIESIDDMSVKSEIYAIVNIDTVETTFSIEPISGVYKSSKDIKVDNLDNSITKNENNIFSRTPISVEDVLNNYLNVYKRLGIGAPERMYNLLDEEYRNLRFGSEDNFKEYINRNKDRIISTRLTKYKTEKKDGYIEYMCIDQNNKYYIFREKGILNYSVILDTYTIDLPEFIEQYKASTQEKRGLLNIEKIVNAINEKDYRYVYNKLNETYRENYFKTQLEFERYIRTIFFDNTKASYGSYEKNGDSYVYEIQLKNEDNENQINKQKIVVRLKEETDFEISFIIE